MEHLEGGRKKDRGILDKVKRITGAAIIGMSAATAEKAEAGSMIRHEHAMPTEAALDMASAEAIIRKSIHELDKYGPDHVFTGEEMIHFRSDAVAYLATHPKQPGGPDPFEALLNALEKAHGGNMHSRFAMQSDIMKLIAKHIETDPLARSTLPPVSINPQNHAPADITEGE